MLDFVIDVIIADKKVAQNEIHYLQDLGEIWDYDVVGHVFKRLKEHSKE